MNGSPVDIQTVLVIDDEPDIRSVLEFTLSALAGWEVVTASTGFEGIQLAQSLLPDVILVDVMMPGMDGPETRRHLALLPGTRDIPVIFMTAKVRFAAERVIVKPFDPSTLAERIVALVGDQGMSSNTPIGRGSDVNAGLQKLWLDHWPDTQRRIDLLRDAAQLWGSDKFGEHLCGEAAAQAHILVGTAGVFQLPEAAAAGKQLQLVFETDGDLYADVDLLALVEQLRAGFNMERAA
jgi:CheY-like chemotaxis protein